MSHNSKPPRYLFREYEILKNIKPGNRFLEIGGGRLQLAKEVSKYYKSGLVIDFDDQIINFYESQKGDLLNIEVKKMNYMCEQPNEVFDLIISCEVMEHIENDHEFVEKIWQNLSDNGDLIISVPAKRKFWTIHDEISGHIKRYEKAELKSLLSIFRDVEIINYGYPFINILRYARIIDTRLRLKDKSNGKSMAQLTVQSNKNNIGGLVSMLINKYTMYPLFKLAALFNKYDLSEGYLVFCKK